MIKTCLWGVHGIVGEKPASQDYNSVISIMIGTCRKGCGRNKDLAKGARGHTAKRTFELHLQKSKFSHI